MYTRRKRIRSIGNHTLVNITKHTYVVNSINKWIVARITHCQPIAAEEYNVDIAIPGK